VESLGFHEEMALFFMLISSQRSNFLQSNLAKLFLSEEKWVRE
jgi:hypothetical protein